MRIAILGLSLTMMLPVAAGAQETDAWRANVVSDASAQTTATAQRPAVRHADTRRRGSMVGYIEDPVVESKVRIRFDAGFHTNAADRAEFFYPKGGWYRTLAATNPNRDPDAPGPGPGLVADLNFQQLYFQAEYSWSGRVGLFAEAPIRSIRPQRFVAGSGTFDNHTGFGDLRAGVKLALVTDSDRNVTVQFKTYFPSGDALKGLGTDHASVEPALLYSQRVSDRLSIESMIGDWHPVGGSKGLPTSTSSEKFSGDVLFYGMGPSYDLVNTDHMRFGPVVELVGWHLLSGFQTKTLGKVDGMNIVNLKLGARVIVDGKHSFYVGYGHGLTDNVWYSDLFRMEYRVGF